AAHGALEAEAFFLEFSPPAALRLFRQRIEAPRDVFGRLHRLLRVAENVGGEHARDRRLLDHLAIVAAMQPVEHVADRARRTDQLSQTPPGAMLARKQPKHRLFEAVGDEMVLERPLVLEILLRLAARDLVQWRLGDEEMAAIDEVAHLTVEKGQQQRA